MCLTDIAGIFVGIVIYISGIFNRSKSATLQPSDFSPAMDGQKTILQNGALPSAAHPLRKITKPLSSLWRFGRFLRGRQMWKSNALSEAAFPTSAPLKNRCNRGGDDRQVSQNGMPFCTGCTLSGHILNLQGSSTPFEPLAGSPKNETAKHPLEVSPFHFRIRWGMYLSHFDLRKQVSAWAVCSPCALYCKRMLLKSANIFLLIWCFNSQMFV